MKHLFRWLLILTNILTVLIMTGGFLSGYLSPSHFWALSLAGLLFPVLAAINLLFLIYWLFVRRKFALLSLAALLIVTPGLNNSFRFAPKRSVNQLQDSFSLMTYNVRLFDVFNWSGRQRVGSDLLQFVGNSETDIICFQEFMTNHSDELNLDRIKASLPSNPHSYLAYNYLAHQRKHGLAIFSAFPVLHGEKGTFPETNNTYIFADIKLPNDTIRVFNVHLESVHLNQQQYNLIDSLNLVPANKQEIKNIIHNVRSAFAKREVQVRILQEELSRSPYPVILCGDFNDTPISHAYRSLRKTMKDSFVESGKGFGSSYRELTLPLRIDYILHSDNIQSSGYEVLDANYSDHRPVKTRLTIKH